MTQHENVAKHFREMPASDLHHMLRAYAAEAAARLIDQFPAVQTHIATGAGVSVEVMLTDPPAFSVMLIDSNDKRLVVARVPITDTPQTH